MVDDLNEAQMSREPDFPSKLNQPALSLIEPRKDIVVLYEDLIFSTY